MMWISTASHLLGGIGLFLVGMLLMSDGLKSAAGEALRSVLDRSTRTPMTGFFWGAGLTAIVQSSSATTLATIGFVSAGLLSFSSAVGVIIGANVGTTSTGWIVSMLGFKLDVASIALPFIGVGALLRLLAGGRRAQIGMALVGFGLIFVGIEFLQDGMAEMAERIDLSRFSAAGLGGRLALVLVGSLMTVFLQSSSAAVAVTLTALYSGAVSIEQSAYLVIGQNLGTTVTAALAAIGASIPARRTAVVHILFNAASALLAFLFAGYLLDLAAVIAGAAGPGDLAVQIALFHTIFNVSGAALVLPFTRPFAGFVARIVRDQGPRITRHLDKSLLAVPVVAVEASARAMREIAAVALEEARALLVGDPVGRTHHERVRAAQEAQRTTISFLAEVDVGKDDLLDRRLALYHAGDHLARLGEAYLESERVIYGDEAREAALGLLPAVETGIDWLHERGVDGDDVVRRAEEASRVRAEARKKHRAGLLRKTAVGELSPDEAQRQLESMRWVDRVAYHVWRTLHHLAGTKESGQQGPDVYEEAEHSVGA